MAEQLELFKLLHSEEIARSMGKILDDAGIPYEIKRSRKYFDPSYAFNNVDPEVNLLLDPRDFSKANEVLKAFYAQQTATVDEGYYLLSFPDRELLDIIRKQDEWGSFDVALARKLLQERGIEITADTEAEVERSRLNELARPEKAPAWMIISGYISVLFGGFFGILFGWLLVALKTLPDGSKVPVYEAGDRLHGRLIMYSGMLVFVIMMIRTLWSSSH